MMARTLLAFALALVSIIALSQTVAASHDEGPDRVYFPQTGQYLHGDFLDYWRHNGAIHVFGYPMTGEFEQDGLIVQYFERAIFEHHPDNPSEHRVLLRRMGADARDDRGLGSHAAFGPAEPSGGSDSEFFDATSHNLSNAFRTYWNDRGGLAIFGYPLSEEFVSEDGLTVQYFERAIFEWHPDNSSDWAVLQERLGAQAAERDGVDTSPRERDPDVAEYHPNLWQSPEPDPPPTGDQTRTPPAGAPSHESRWIEVDLTNQVTRAWRGDQMVYSAISATGRPAVPTVTGTFQIWIKLRYDRMTGWTPDRGSYDLPDVPYVMYFHRGYGLHGTYWHQAFGTPQSAGCVNLTIEDAAWFYNFADVGTTVYVHGRTPGT